MLRMTKNTASEAAPLIERSIALLLVLGLILGVLAVLRPFATGAGDYLLSINVTAPTAARFDNDPASAPSATRYSDGASVRWQTGYEVENLRG